MTRTTLRYSTRPKVIVHPKKYNRIVFIYSTSYHSKPSVEHKIYLKQKRKKKECLCDFFLFYIHLKSIGSNVVCE